MRRQESQDVHQHQENKRVLALKRMAVRGNDYRGKHHYSPKRWTRQSASATSTCGSNPSRVLACNSCRNLRARTFLALLSSRPVACQRSNRPKLLMASCRHFQLSSRPPLCRHLSLSFATKLAKAATASKDGAGPPLQKAFIERVPEVAPRRSTRFQPILKLVDAPRVALVCS